MIIENKYRSRACGEVSESDIGKVIRVAGWVENIRDHGGIRFVDLRVRHRTGSHSRGQHARRCPQGDCCHHRG